MKRIHILDQRFYRKDDLFFPSVTTILGETLRVKGIENWLKSVGFNSDIISETAKTRGSKTHHGIERLLSGERVKYDDYDSDVYLMIQRAVKFLRNLKMSSWYVEESLFYNQNGIIFAGTADLIVKLHGGTIKVNRKEYELDSGWYLIDWKTGGEYSIPHKMQLSSYAEAINNSDLLDGDKLVGAMDIYLEAKNKDKLKVSYLDKYQLTDEWIKFINVYRVYVDHYRIPNPVLYDIEEELVLFKNKEEGEQK